MAIARSHEARGHVLAEQRKTLVMLTIAHGQCAAAAGAVRRSSECGRVP
jgi:hypothetical protein